MGGGLAVWFFPIVSAGRCPVPSCKRKSLSGLIVGRAFVLSGGVAGSVAIVALALVNLDKVIFNTVNKPVHIVNAAAPISA